MLCERRRMKNPPQGPRGLPATHQPASAPSGVCSAGHAPQALQAASTTNDMR